MKANKLMTKTELLEEIMFLKCDVEAKQKYINNMDKYIKELIEENKHLNIYTQHLNGCKMNSGFIVGESKINCDCGLE